MHSIRRTVPGWGIATVAVLAALWVALSIPLALGRGDAEAFFLRTFKDYARAAHPYVSLSSSFRLLWIAHSCLLVFCAGAMMQRKKDLLIVFVIGPALALVLACLTLQWPAPDWLVFTGVCLVGCLVGIVSGCAYCIWKTFVHASVEPSDGAESR